MSYKRRAVELNPEEFEELVLMLQAKIPTTKSDNEEDFFKKLLFKMEATPCYDNPVVMGHRDFQAIISNTITKFASSPLHAGLSNIKLTEQENKYLCLAHCVVMWLNLNSNLRRIVDFDHTDESLRFESTED